VASHRQPPARGEGDIGFLVGIMRLVGVELWGWSADEYKVGFVGFGYFFALICGALAGSFVVSRLHKTPAKVSDNPIDMAAPEYDARRYEDEAKR
jgi:hypothetical protein